MTKEELILQGASKVRNDKNLLALYVELFKAQFGYKPVCAGCTFSTDWKKFISTNNKTHPIMQKSFIVKDGHKIHTYKKDKQTFRMYGYNMTEEFAQEYLTNGTTDEIEERKKDFRELPESFNDEVKAVDIKSLTKNELKELYPHFKDAKTKKEILELIKNEQ